MKTWNWRRITQLTALTLAYYLTGRLGLSLAAINPSASAVWAPTGLAIAAFLILGRVAWPAILWGAFLVNMTTSGSLTASLAIAGGNTLEGLVGAELIIRFAHGRKAFARAADVFKFALFGAAIAPMVSATNGALALIANHLAVWKDLPAIWATWWLGDACGALVVVPVLVLAFERPFPRWTRLQVLESVGILTGFVLAGIMAFTSLSPVGMYDYPLFLLVVPLVLAAAFRLRRVETAIAILILSVMAIMGTHAGLGPFARYEPNTALLLLQVFMALTTMIGLVVAAEVTDRRRAEAALREREQLYHLVIESATDAILTIDECSVITYCNKAAESMFGYTRDELIGHELTLLMPESARMPHLAGFVKYLRTGNRTMSWQGREVLGRHRDGRPLPIEISFGEHHTSRRLFTGVIRDISERNAALEAQRWLATIVANSNDAVIGKDLDGRVLSWNQGAEQLFGYTADEMIGQSISKIYPPELMDECDQILLRLRRGETIGHFESVRMRKDGVRFPISLAISPIDDGMGHRIGASSVGRDITAQKEAEDRIRHIALHDALTGLPNRRMFREYLAKEVAAAAREQRRIAVLFIDLDHFKEVNDTRGHDVGDQLLRTVAQRLQHNLRTGDLVARLGGDEFVIVLGGRPTVEESQAIAEKILASLRTPILIMDQELHISASLGIGLFPEDGGDEMSLLQSADKAMYQAKQKGRNNCQTWQAANSDQPSDTSVKDAERGTLFGTASSNVHLPPLSDTGERDDKAAVSGDNHGPSLNDPETGPGGENGSNRPADGNTPKASASGRRDRTRKTPLDGVIFD